jgi:hypothetical protein
MTHSLALKNKKNSSVPFLKIYIILCQEGHRRRINFLTIVNWVSIPSKDEIFLFSAVSKLALGPSQHPIQLLPEIFVEGKVVGMRNWLLICI